MTTRYLLASVRLVLPEYMVPTTLTQVAAIPLTVNGMVDFARLSPAQTRKPEWPLSRIPAALTARAPTDLRTSSLRIWSRSLGVPVRPEDNFFELGGNSLLVIRVLAEMRDAGMPKLSARDFYGNSTAGGSCASSATCTTSGSPPAQEKWMRYTSG